MIGRTRNSARNLALCSVACLTSLVLCELVLRFFHPQYEAAAEARYDLDEFRIWKRTPNGRYSAEHPDIEIRHFGNHNNLALRQERDFREQEIALNSSIGFFGDSNVENIRVAAQYSFTEPLDYLLNFENQTKSNVLNFGVEGYGPGQSFLHYRHFPYSGHLDHVFYVYCDNDLENIYETGLFRLDDDGNLMQNVLSSPSPWISLVSGFHLSYLLLDAIQRLSILTSEYLLHEDEDEIKRKMTERRNEKYETETAESMSRDIDEAIIHNENVKNNFEIFKQLMFTWKELVENNGGRFYVVVLPYFTAVDIIPFLQDDFDIIDLDSCFVEHDGEHAFTHWEASPYRFRNDWHWNEAGNRLAAICLYRFLEQEMDLPTISEDDLQGALERYYSAFEEAGHIEDSEQELIRTRYGGSCASSTGSGIARHTISRACVSSVLR